MLGLLQIVAPVFLIVGAGYVATRTGAFRHSAVDGLIAFTQNFAIPCLLFRAIAQLDISHVFNPGLLISFYAGATICFVLGVIGARTIFRRRPGEAVAIGFSALFSNTVLLGLPIMERAYGAGALPGNYAIVALHAPFCFLLGISFMEFARTDGRGLLGTVRGVVAAMFRNALMIGILLGFIANIGDIRLPGTVNASIDMMIRAALPAALFGLGGVLTRYRIRASLGEAAMTSTLSLMVHPAIALLLATQVFAVSQDFVRSAVVTAAMAPGVNAFVFASMYDRAKGIAATTVLLSTAISILTVTFWLGVLGR
ncbi:MAG: AEC family transporter [Paracoccaceae bacterium]